MAKERTKEKKILGDSLDSFVSGISRTFSDQMVARNSEKETQFNQLVLEGGIPLESQLDFRKKQLLDVSDDPQERTRIKGEISSLKQRIIQKTFSDAYTSKLIDYNSGMSSIDSVISFLQDQKANATDQGVIDLIDKQLVQKADEKFKLTQSMIKDQTEYAVRDKSGSTLSTQITKVSTARANAVIAGDDATTAMLDLQLQSLKQAEQENNINTDIQHFASSTISGFASATSLLDAYNSKVNTANSSGPITIGGITYPSARDFWTYKRDSYVSDQSDSGFISRLGDEVKTNIKVLNSKNILSSDQLQSALAPFDSIVNRPELAGYANQIANEKQDSLQTGATLIANTVESNYAVNYDIGKAITSLNTLKTMGANVDSSYAKIITAGANVKDKQVSGILTSAQQAMQNDPTLTAEQAINLAVTSGAGQVLSPDQLVTTPESKIVKEQATTAAAGGYKDNPATTIPPAPVPTPSATPQAAQDSGKTVTIKSGDTLSALAALHGTTVQELQQFNNIQDPNKIQAGAVLKIPGQPAPAPASAPAPTPTPTATTTPPQTTTPPVQTAAAPTPTPTPQAPTTPKTYLIKSGDTLSQIAKTNGTTIENLAKLNNIPDVNKIKAGATINLT